MGGPNATIAPPTPGAAGTLPPHDWPANPKRWCPRDNAAPFHGGLRQDVPPSTAGDKETPSSLLFL
jgi:hypothetical protein